MNHEGLIDKHFAGKLSAEETEQLMEAVKEYPHVAEEFYFQEELTTSIKEARRRELKSKLASLPVPKVYNPNPLYWGAAACIGVLLSGLYFYNFSEKTTPTTDATSENMVVVKTETIKNNNITPKTIVTEPGNTTAEMHAPEETLAVAKEDSRLNSYANPVSKEKPVEVITDKKAEPHSTVKNKKEIQYNNLPEPSVNTAIAEYDDVHKSSDVNAPVNNLTSTTRDNKVSEIIPKIEANNKSYKKYQYDGQNLTLVGDYNSDIPYILYEIKLDSEKKLYLKFENQYYEIKNTGSKTTRLEILTDPVVINELENK